MSENKTIIKLAKWKVENLKEMIAHNEETIRNICEKLTEPTENNNNLVAERIELEDFLSRNESNE